MKIASTIARYLLGFVFLVFGLNGFLHFIPTPPPPGPGGMFMGGLYMSHELTVIMALQLVCGILLLAGRFVPLALAVLGPIIVNIFLFHAFMAPAGLPVALLTVILWFLTYWSVRTAFSGLFQARPSAINANYGRDALSRTEKLNGNRYRQFRGGHPRPENRKA